MRENYFDISECTEDELNQLKWALYFSDDADLEEVLDEEDWKTLSECDCPEDIPYKLLETVYGHICFVAEDFFCNCE